MLRSCALLYSECTLCLSSNSWKVASLYALRCGPPSLISSFVAQLHLLSVLKLQIFDPLDNELAHEYYGIGKILADRYAIIEHNLSELF